MKLSITLVTFDYRGDHSADVRVALDFDPSTTLAEVAAALHGSVTDHVELRLVKQRDGKP